MAFADRMPGSHRPAALVAVAGLHGLVLYALVTGLGVAYVEQFVPTLTGRNIPADPPPSPPSPRPEPPATRSERQVVQSPFVPAPREPLLPMPKLDPGPVVFDPPQTAGDLIVSEPRTEPSPPGKGLTPRGVRPLGSPAAWVSTDDYPGASLRRGEQGTVRYALAIGPDGRVQDCRITASSGSAELDAATCRHVTRRARFEAATDGEGAAVAGTYAGSVRWVIPED